MSIRLLVDAKLKVSQCCYYTQCMLVCSLGVAQLGRGVNYFDPAISSMLNLELSDKTFCENVLYFHLGM